MKRVIAVIGFSLCLAASSEAQYTFQTIDLPAAGGAIGRDITLLDVNNTSMIAGDDNAINGLGSRITPALQVHPVLCPPEQFTRYQFSGRQGPQVKAINNGNMVTGDDEGEDGLYGMTQAMDGTCEFFRYPGSVGTTTTTITDTGLVAGFYWNEECNGAGLLCFHGFRKDASGFATFDGPQPNDVVFPTACNALGDCVGYLYQDVQGDNSYTYQAFYWSNGVFTLVDSPTGEDLWLLGLNNVGQAVGVVGSDGVSGGQAIMYDTATQAFTFLPEPAQDTPWILPRGINDNGVIVGLYGERIAGTESTILHQFLATPDTVTVENVPDDPIPAPTPDKHKKHKRHKPWKDSRHVHREFKRLCPIYDTDGKVLLANNEVAYGKKHLKHMRGE